MNIVQSSQQFNVQHQQIQLKGQLNLPATPTTSDAVTIVDPVAAANTVPDAAPAVTTETESTASEQQNEDGRPFNALQTVGAVKRILEQLHSGKLMSWIEGNNFEKIKAQATAQQQANADADTAANAQGVTIAEWSYRFEQLSANLSGELQLADGHQFSWSVDVAMQSEYFSFQIRQQPALTDPLIVNLDQQPLRLSKENQAFDFYHNGQQKQLNKLTPGQYYLAMDQNNNQQIDHGFELFGPRTGQGFSELAELDLNQNGFIDAQDPHWSQLGLWRPGQPLMSLAQAGIAAISVQSAATRFDLYDQDKLLAQIQRSGIFIQTQGQVGLVHQVDLNI